MAVTARMEQFTKEELDEAETFGKFYIDLVENRMDFTKYYLAETAVLDWFGQTVKGEKNIAVFMKKTVANCKHLFEYAKPVRTIGFRDTHVIKMPSIKKPQPRLNLSADSQSSNDETTPPNTHRVETTAAGHIEEGQGDGFHNTCDSLGLPPKKSRIDDEIGAVSATNRDDSATDEAPVIKYASADGSVEFRKPSSKKLQAETKWLRSCKLQIAYTANGCAECTIYLIIYEGNMKCRRNLFKEFEDAEAQRD